MRSLIAPSILSADFSKLGDEIQAVLAAGADVIHFDVMDNHYVPNLSFGPVVLQSLKKRFSTVEFDVHLMVTPVESLIDAFIDSGATYISIHPEATQHLHAAVQRIQDGGVRAGIVLNPGTPLGVLDSILDNIDLILIMSVNPGFGGQKFLPESLPKLTAAKSMIDRAERPIRLEIDGGINVENIGLARQAGADMFVAGSAIFESANYFTVISQMRALIDQKN